VAISAPSERNLRSVTSTGSLAASDLRPTDDIPQADAVLVRGLPTGRSFRAERHRLDERIGGVNAVAQTEALIAGCDIPQVEDPVVSSVASTALSGLKTTRMIAVFEGAEKRSARRSMSHR